LALSFPHETCDLWNVMKPLTPLRLACVLALSALAVGAAEPAKKPLELPKMVVIGRQVIELPPFVVTGFAFGPNWRYASIPGYEIITQCSDAESRAIIESIHRGRQLMLASELWTDFAVPMTVVLFNQPMVSSGQPASFGSVQGPGETGRHWTNLIKRTLDDRESFALNLWPGSFNYSSTFRFHTRTLLRRRAPAVPAWLNEGLMGSFGVYREGVYWHEASRTKLLIAANWHSAEEIKTATTRALSGEAARQLARRPLALSPSPLLPFLSEFSVLFESDPPEADDPAAPRWACTAALFARWGIYGRSRPEQAAEFWRFADRASREPVTEQLFRECFGQSYAEVRNELAWYLPPWPSSFPSSPRVPASRRPPRSTAPTSPATVTRACWPAWAFSRWMQAITRPRTTTLRPPWPAGSSARGFTWRPPACAGPPPRSTTKAPSRPKSWPE
jgi:hypothetical protein